MEKTLTAIATQILRSATPSEEIDAGRSLERFFNNYMEEAKIRENTNESKTQGGIALSPQDAAKCLKDYHRTVRFIKGSHRAIERLFSKFPDEEIHLLYAGCGPFATIITPILSLFSPHRLKITLLDIHEFSLTHASNLLKDLNLSSFIYKTIIGDACTYQKGPNEKIHLLVSETMFRGLIREPQYLISTNLAPQLTEGGLLIPEEIRIEAGYSFFGNEPYFQFGDNGGTEKCVKINFPQRAMIGTVLQLNKFSTSGDVKQKLSKPFQAPEHPLTEQPDLCLFTTVKIFEDIVLGSTESTITNPQVICPIANRYDNRWFRLCYNFQDIPEWKFLLEN